MGAKIEAYFDLSSPYSYIAFTELRNVRETLKAHGVEVEFHPVFLGAINVGSGNKPPWTNPVKAAYGWKFETARSLARVGLSHLSSPPDMMASGMTVLPMRALSFIKRQYPRDVLETAWLWLYHCFWTPPNPNLSTDPAVLARLLGEARAGFRGVNDMGEGSPLLFSKDEVEAIMKATQTKEIKDLLRDTTQQALDRGAYGAPWIWVTNAEGKGEPFFGSDRFNHIYRFLGLPYQEVTLLPPGEDGSRAKL